MKAKKIADALGLPDARKLSMALQWDKLCINVNGRWKLCGDRREPG